VRDKKVKEDYPYFH